MSAARRIEVRPVSNENWAHFVRLFEAKGSPHYCWCALYRFRGARDLTKHQKKQRMQSLVEEKAPIGVLAYEQNEPVGWCSIAPRETYVRLQRSRTMPRATADETPTWTIVCFFVVRAARGRGVSRALLEGAVAYAKEQGAEIVEGYPFDTAGISATHRGHSTCFSGAGFRQDGKRWFRRVARR
jgi:GNAT superfamily N-acetyltransferase